MSVLWLMITLLVPGVIHAAEFPRVAPAEQQSRDSDRVRIISDELKAVREKLADATARKDTDAIARHTADIASLESELGKRPPLVLAAAPKAKKASNGMPDAFGRGMPDAFGAKVQD